jgi:hypothetical protein
VVVVELDVGPTELVGILDDLGLDPSRPGVVAVHVVVGDRAEAVVEAAVRSGISRRRNGERPGPSE